MNPLSSRKTIDAPRHLAFFYPLPVLPHPTTNRLFVALDRPARWCVFQAIPDGVSG
jgi:hypothetical protein